MKHGMNALIIDISWKILFALQIRIFQLSKIAFQHLSCFVYRSMYTNLRAHFLLQFWENYLYKKYISLYQKIKTYDLILLFF